MAVVAGFCVVTKKAKPFHNRADQRRLDDAIVALIANTRRGKRRLSLLEIREKLRTAVELLGSLRAVADVLGLSQEMLRQFTRVEKLSAPVRALVAARKLDSVDLADRLSRLPLQDQLPVTERAISGELTPADVRAILGVRRTSPQTPINEIIDRIIASRNIREYVAEFLAPTPAPTHARLMTRLSRLLGKQHIRRVEMNENAGRVVLDSQGRSALEQGAKKMGLTKREFLQRLVSGEA